MRDYPNVWRFRYRSWIELGVHHSDDPDTRIRKGIVRVQYRNGSWHDFDNIDRKEFFKWADGGFKPRFMPAGIIVKPPRVKAKPQAIEEPEEENAGPYIADTDYLGQVTGRPTRWHKAYAKPEEPRRTSHVSKAIDKIRERLKLRKQGK